MIRAFPPVEDNMPSPLKSTGWQELYPRGAIGQMPALPLLVNPPGERKCVKIEVDRRRWLDVGVVGAVDIDSGRGSGDSVVAAPGVLPGHIQRLGRAHIQR